MQDIKGTIVNITKNVTKTSSDLLKTTKLNMNLSTEEGNLRNLYYEIGKKVHEIYQYGGSLGKYFDEKYLEIEANERKIEEIKEQIGVIKGIRECPKCSKKVERVAEFCPKCGIRLMEAAITPHDTATVDDTKKQMQPYPENYSVPSLPLAPETAMPSISAQMIAPAVVPTTKRCRVCNAENEASTKFCLSCGRIID